MRRGSAARGRERPAGGALRRAAAPLWAACVVAIVACDRAPAPGASGEGPKPIPISVLADTSAAARLRVVRPQGEASRTPEARAWLARVSAADVRPAPAPRPALPEALPDVPPPRPGPTLEVDPGLKPPIPRNVVTLVLPPSGAPRSGPASVELDVLVDETGTVGEVSYAGGSDDPGLIDAAVACARRMRFYPALRAGRPVAVWCRQRFDFDPR